MITIVIHILHIKVINSSTNNRIVRMLAMIYGIQIRANIIHKGNKFGEFHSYIVKHDFTIKPTNHSNVTINVDAANIAVNLINLYLFYILHCILSKFIDNEFNTICMLSYNYVNVFTITTTTHNLILWFIY